MRRPAPRPATGLVALCLTAWGLSGCGKPAPTLVPTLEPLQQLKQDVTAATMLPGVERAAWGIVVHSLDRNERILELNPRTLLVPASTAKLVSLASAVDAVGWDYRYETIVRASAPIVDGTIQGDLLVVGSGDPSIGGRAGAPLSAWVDALKALGLRRIDGRVIGDDDAIEEPRPQLAWAWDDLGYPTGALFGALNLAENRMEIIVNPGQALDYQPTFSMEPAAWARPLRNRTVTGPPQSPLLLWPEQRPGEPFLTIAGSIPIDAPPARLQISVGNPTAWFAGVFRAALISGDIEVTGPPQSPLLLWPEQRPGEPFLTIAGSIPIDAPPARLQISVGNPTAWFAGVFRAALVSGGIEVTGEAYDVDDVAQRPEWQSATVLYAHRSATLAEIAQPMIKNSINLYGEAVLRLNAAKGAVATNDLALDGLRARMTAWGIPADSWQIIDGSGLSRRDAIAPEALVAILQRMYDPAGASPWMTALPVAGRDGTLAGRMIGTPAEGNVRAKTGTMSNIRALAGYVRTRDGENLAFAILADNFEGSGAAATDAIDRIAVRLATFSRARH